MMKHLDIRLKDMDGKLYRWTIKHEPRLVCCELGKRQRIVSGWTYTDHEGYSRFSEGAWNHLVSAFKLTAENYGLQLVSGLD